MDKLGATGPHLLLRPLWYGLYETDQGMIVLVHNRGVGLSGVLDGER